MNNTKIQQQKNYLILSDEVSPGVHFMITVETEPAITGDDVFFLLFFSQKSSECVAKRAILDPKGGSKADTLVNAWRTGRKCTT